MKEANSEVLEFWHVLMVDSAAKGDSCVGQRDHDGETGVGH